jgi:hypothetical protein
MESSKVLTNVSRQDGGIDFLDGWDEIWPPPLPKVVVVDTVG